MVFTSNVDIKSFTKNIELIEFMNLPFYEKLITNINMEIKLLSTLNIL